ncbi:putative RNA methyltransferase At5g51130 [Porphyridium purpureum]|uniref:RNA methyltransferase n=1 Tax=Porphyridium purpureum TaxID=35688 RepID=A0A5J4Z674_PORPP|nr:putative RNA methyltransferase At5g51130 [Porphyridium purpureum]|eukprot:POR7665..scf295_1
MGAGDGDKTHRSEVSMAAESPTPGAQRVLEEGRVGNYHSYYGKRRKLMAVFQAQNAQATAASGADEGDGDENTSTGHSSSSTAPGSALYSDERLDLLKEEWVRGKRVLDLGCNDGTFVYDLVARFQPRSVLGVDIDRALIDDAKKRRKNMRRRWRQNSGRTGEAKSSTDPLLCVHFCCEDIISPDAKWAQHAGAYDLVLLMSVTKWIHLHHGDAGIKQVFKNVANVLAPRGVFVLEYQRWSTYRRKANLSTEVHQNYKSIRLRPEVFDTYLEHECGLKPGPPIRPRGVTGQPYNRPMLSFRKGPV